MDSADLKGRIKRISVFRDAIPAAICAAGAIRNRPRGEEKSSVQDR